MITKAIDPVLLQIGDPVIINQERGTIRAVDGPDNHGTFDVYMDTHNGRSHKVVQDFVQVVVAE
jgi:hypothetical protein